MPKHNPFTLTLNPNNVAFDFFGGRCFLEFEMQADTQALIRNNHLRLTLEVVETEAESVGRRRREHRVKKLKAVKAWGLTPTFYNDIVEEIENADQEFEDAELRARCKEKLGTPIQGHVCGEYCPESHAKPRR